MYQFTNSAFNKETVIEEDNGNQLQYSNINDASLFDDNNIDSKNQKSSMETESRAASVKPSTTKLSDEQSTTKLSDEQSTENFTNTNISADDNNPSNIQLTDCIINRNNETIKVAIEDNSLKEKQSNVTEADSSFCNKIDCDNADDLNEDSRDGDGRNNDFEDSSGDDDEGEGTMSSDDDSQFSNLTGLSEMSGQEWKPMVKPLNWVQKQIHSGTNPRDILSQILSTDTAISDDLNDMTLWKILASMLSEPPRRQKLSSVNTLSDVVQLLKESKNIIVLTGAGVSVSCGIPDFRSSDGIYSRLAKDYPDLPDPQAMFDIHYFSKDPRPFYKFAREIYPGQFVPSPCHRFIKLLEKMNKLLRNYTQNIDTLEQVAGIRNVIECHGSFATASCTKCKFKQTADDIREAIFAQRIPLCPKCQPNQENIPIEAKTSTNTNITTDSTDTTETTGTTGEIINPGPHEINFKQLVQNGIMKPDIVFFGEGLPDAFHTAMSNDKDKCDLLIVVGSSLKVRPVALIPNSIPSDVPQILINRERLNHLEFDVELLGDSDVIINQICHMLGPEWSEASWKPEILTETLELRQAQSPAFVSPPVTSLVTNNVDLIDLDLKKYSSNSRSSSYNETTTSTNSSTATFIGGYCDSGFESSSSSSIIRSSSVSPSVSSLSPSYNLEDYHKQKQQHLHSRQQHLNSVDSSKDSGIQYDASSSYNECRENPLNQIQNVGDRLYENTYYYHSKSVYVFPGAQVCFSSDSESEEDDIIDNFDEKIKTDELIVLNEKESNFKDQTIEEHVVKTSLGKRSIEENISQQSVMENPDLQPPVAKKR